jgi:hypothetical protein
MQAAVSSQRSAHRRRPGHSEDRNGPRSFTVTELYERTPGLTGPERMAVFYLLPAILVRQAWDHLAELATHRSQRDLEELEHGD